MQDAVTSLPLGDLYDTHLELTRGWPRETAPAVLLNSAVICFASCASWPNSLVPEDQMEVSPLSRAVINRYPLHYKMAFACSTIPYPPSRQLALRFAFPHGKTSGLPRSACRPEWVRSRLFAGGAYVCEWRGENSATRPLTFWSKPRRLAAAQPLWLVSTNDVYQRFTCVDHAIQPWLPTALRLAVVIAPRGFDDHLSMRLRCPQSSRTAGLLQPHVWVGYPWQNTG